MNFELQAARLERSSFCEAKRNKKAGAEGGNSCHKKILNRYSTQSNSCPKNIEN
jgi:hypothetical protein